VFSGDAGDDAAHPAASSGTGSRGTSPFERLDAFVSSADNRLIDRLSFAVGETGGRRTIVLRVRASNQLPPVLVLDGALACRNYLKKPNLFVPCNARLHPPVNPKVVNKLLASDPTQIVWLREDGSSGFTVESLPDASFQPLHKWVDYVLQKNIQPLQAWVAAHQFEFEPFVCREDRMARAKKPPPRKERGDRSSTPASDESELPAATVKKPTKQPQTGTPEAFTPAKRRGPGALEKQLLAMQAEFRASEEPLDSEERSAQWRGMGQLYAELGASRHDCTICWVNGLWESDTPPREIIAAWQEAEKPGASARPLTGEELNAMTPQEPRGPAELAALAAYLVWASIQNPPPEEVVSRLQQTGRYLQQHERDMPVRVAWLAWHALVAMSSGDELTLARARDRLLARLHQQGMQPNLDMAGFLRTSGGGDTSRIAELQQQLPGLHKKALAWVKESVSKSDAPPEALRLTPPHVDLMFAVGYARGGELRASKAARQNGERELEDGGDLHAWCRDAFRHRIAEAVDARPPAPLEGALITQLKALQKSKYAYALDKYRERSRMLHDGQKINEYAHTIAIAKWQKEFVRLAGASHDELHDGILRLMQTAGNGRSPLGERASIIKHALEFAPRLGDATGRELLDQACKLLDNEKLPLYNRAGLLDKGLLVAAHFDQLEFVRVFLNELETTVPALIEGFFTPVTTGENSEELAWAVDSLFKQCLRGMRKMGLRTETSRLLEKLQEALSAHVRKKTKKKSAAKEFVKNLQLDLQWGKLQLHVAAGYFYFGREDEAARLIDEVRNELFQERFIPNPVFKTQLVCAYIDALAHAPIAFAVPRIQELFNTGAAEKKLAGVVDNRTNATAYMLAISPLQVVESAVLALCGEDFGLDRESRRWLDEDEFLVRRRIHRDVRPASG